MVVYDMSFCVISSIRQIKITVKPKSVFKRNRMFGSNNYTAPMATGKRVTGYQNRRQAQFKLGWEVADQTNEHQLRRSKNKEITGKITTGLSLPKTGSLRNQYGLAPFNKINEPAYIKNQNPYHAYDNRLSYQQSNSPIQHHNFDQQVDPYHNHYNKQYQGPQPSYNDHQKRPQQSDRRFQSQSRQKYLSALQQAEQSNQAHNYSHPLQTENSNYLQQNQQYKRAMEQHDRALRNQEQQFGKAEHPLERMAIAQRNSKKYEAQSDQLQKAMASYNPKQAVVGQRYNVTPSQNSAYSKPSSNTNYQTVERRTPIRPKQSIRDVIFNGVGVGQPSFPQRNAARRVNSNIILGGDNYAFTSHRAN